MTARDLILAMLGVAFYNLYWRHLSVEQRFIRRNRLQVAPISNV